MASPPEFRRRGDPEPDIHERRRRFATLCAFDLPPIREDLQKVLSTWSECLDDLVAVGVIREGHRSPQGLDAMREEMPKVRAAVALIDVMIRKLRELEGA